MAKNRSPGCKRAGVDRDAADRRARAARSARPSARVSSASVHSARHAASSQRRPRGLGVGKRQRPIADDLAGFMAFAGDHQRVARAEHRDRGADRLAAVADLARARRGGENGGADRRRILGARIVVGDDRRRRRRGSRSRPSSAACRRRGRRRSRRRRSAGLRTKGRKRRERLLQRVGLVGVVDEDRRAVLVADPLEPARRAFERLQRGEHRLGIASRREAQSPAATSALETWKSPGSGSRSAMRAPGVLDGDARRKAVAARRRSAAASPPRAPDREQPQAARARGLDRRAARRRCRRRSPPARPRAAARETGAAWRRDRPPSSRDSRGGRATDW